MKVLIGLQCIIITVFQIYLPRELCLFILLYVSLILLFLLKIFIVFMAFKPSNSFLNVEEFSNT